MTSEYIKTDLEYQDDEYKGKPISEEELDLFEKTTGYKLPESYKDFLRKHNGGYLKGVIGNDGECLLGMRVTYYDGTKDFVYIDQIEKLETIDEGEYFFITDSWSEEDFGELIEGQLIIGGDSSNGNNVSITLSDNGYGEIYYWSNFLLNLDPKKDRVKIADNFEEFLNKFEYQKY